MVTIFSCKTVTKEQSNTYDQKSGGVCSLYTDTKHHYSLPYPAGLIVTQKQAQIIDVPSDLGSTTIALVGGVNIAQTDGFGIIDVSIYKNTKFTSPDDWLAKENERSSQQKRVLEKGLTIGDIEAIVIHTESNYEDTKTYYPEKTVVFVRDNDLFKITTRFAEESDHQKVWDGFTIN